MLEVGNISKKYTDFELLNVSFQVPKGSYFVLLGPSGAGKTQVLEIISGLINPDKGKVVLDGRDMTSLESRRRPLGIVFQDLAVFPHLNVEKNIFYGLKGMDLPPAEARQKLQETSQRLGISQILGRKPGKLSGGELQRVALARTLVRNPEYLLLDEPFASLDVNLRQDLFTILKELHRSGQTILHVTHDYEESLVLATHVSVMNNGQVIQSGTAEEVFHRPGSEFVARFTGIKNYFPANLQTAGDRQIASLSNGMEIRIITDQPDGNGFVMIPGEEIILSRTSIDSSATNRWSGMIREIFDVPGGSEVMVDTGIPLYVKITRESLENLRLKPGQEVYLAFKASGIKFIRA